MTDKRKFRVGQDVRLANQPDQSTGTITQIIDSNAPVSYYWVYWPSADKTWGYREDELSRA